MHKIRVTISNVLSTRYALQLFGLRMAPPKSQIKLKSSFFASNMAASATDGSTVDVANVWKA